MLLLSLFLTIICITVRVMMFLSIQNGRVRCCNWVGLGVANQEWSEIEGSHQQPKNWPRWPATMRVQYNQSKPFRSTQQKRWPGGQTKKLPIWSQKYHVIVGAAGLETRCSIGCNLRRNNNQVIQASLPLCKCKPIWNQTNLTSCFSLFDILCKALGELVSSNFTGQLILGELLGEWF